MNDRFKFRVWHTPDYDESEMIYDAQATYDNACFGTGSFYHCTFQEVLDDKNCVVMQCTGMKDKNGKLIYEGDIIEVQYIGGQIPLFKNEYSAQPENERFAIIYDENFHQYRCVNDYYRSTCEIHSLEFYKIQINTENKLYEVIGNIYENKELLENTDER